MKESKILRPGELVDHKSQVTNDLIITLINRKVINTGTELLIPRAGLDFNGTITNTFFHLVEVISTEIVNGIGVCKAFSIDDNTKFKIRASDIYLIDGMEPARIARSYGFKIDGSKRPSGKKRGRKTKIKNKSNKNNHQQMQI